MSNPSPAFIVVIGVIMALFAVIGFAVAMAPLKQPTVERFERRQAVQLTAANAEHVVGALTITHRWRRSGLVLGLLLGMAWSLKDGQLTFSVLAGLLGWFAGLLVAQWRIGTLRPAGERRAASLASRSLRSYVSTTNLTLVGALGAALAIVGVVAVVRAGLSTSWVLWALYSLALVAGVALTARAVVNRPSGFVERAVREGDDALRCHSLTVVAGSAIALTYPPLAAFAEMALTAEQPVDGLGLTLLIMLACLVLGWYVATSSRSVRLDRKQSQVQA